MLHALAKSPAVIDAPSTSHTAPAEPGTTTTPPCCCERLYCAGTTACHREFAATETGWRRIADRRPNWVLANGQAV